MTTARMIELAAAAAIVVASVWVYRKNKAVDRGYGSQGAVLLFVVGAIMAVHALGLHQPVFLGEKFTRHTVEGFGQLAQFIARREFDMCAPVASRDLSCCHREFCNGSSQAGCCPAAEDNSDEDAGPAYE